MVINGYVFKPDQYLLPAYKLTPFSTTDIETSKRIAITTNELNHSYWNLRFEDYFNYYTINGRQALCIALSHLNLSPHSLVSIITTSNNFYISSCVTKEIEKFCKWNREITEETDVIFVNHEFGFPYEDMSKLKEYGLPIIEDCAYSFNSNNKELSVGTIGDYVIFSFPKFFPIQLGGLLLSKKKVGVSLSKNDHDYINRVICNYIPHIESFSRKRVDNFEYFKESISQFRCYPRFELNKNTIPGVFLFSLPDNIEAIELKKHFYSYGIECSVFYGENALFLPCHHNIHKHDIDYFMMVMLFFTNNNIVD